MTEPDAVLALPPDDRPLFRRFGRGPSATPPFHRIHHAFESHAARSPHARAVEHEGVCLTYGELDHRANVVAAELLDAGVRPGDHVGVFLTRSVHLVVGILAVLKVGAAYVPQDVRITPKAHLDHVIRTAEIDVVLTTGEHAPHVRGLAAPKVLALDALPDRRVGPPRTEPGDTAVVIFTSGTTGVPNGVRVTHANLCNVLLTAPGDLGIRPGDRVAQLLNIAFDMAVWELFGALAHGATSVIRGRDIGETAKTATVLIATPGVLSTVDPDACPDVRTVAVAGERCPKPLADAWSARAAFHNACGPTEVTIVNTVQRYDPAKGRLTIGRPVPNSTVYVLDQDLRPCRIGEVGEMWAGGACVTAGYLGNDVLTAQRYRPDPFLGGDHLMFRTRDLGRWTPDGELEHHGRTDDQVKVRGFRVELDAVTSALETTPGCARATTVLHDGRLVGFVSPASVDPRAATDAVAGSLPYYCVPSLVVAVDDLPLTARGKVDRAALSSLVTVA
ncbi:amino acid adenylation domain-containing protein [Saccharothrix luteola]|uniref:amino acid adenylation domain-containing protein n=1 Tax=Saccharothrix luteola TaxID=2893018 RepID=UPI001E2D6874|nr:amino acid adenylation domain-containing protein [Saccharothrix luteola]MCC8243510.1 amino acid adenylation domain-containing protein [Saccharothrix luteola]